MGQFPTDLSRSHLWGALPGLADLRLADLDAEPFQTDIVALAAGEQLDRADAEILEDLGAEADFQPFAFAALRFGMGFAALVARFAAIVIMADADGAFTQVDDDAAPFRGDLLHVEIDRALPAEKILGDIFRMQAHGDVDAVADVAEDDGEMLHRVPGQGIGMGLGLAEGRVDVEARAVLDQRFLALAIGDEIGDGDELQPVLLGEFDHLRTAGDCAVVIDQFGDHADRRQAGEAAEIDGGFRMAGAHQHAAFARNQREDVAGTDEIGRPDIRVGEVAHRQRPVVGRDAGRRAVLEIDRDGEGGRVGGIVFRHHGVEVEAFGLFLRHRRADDAGGVAHDEGHLFRRGVHGGDDQVALVLAVIVVHDDDDFAGLEGPDGVDDAFLIVRHGRSYFRRPVWPRSRR
ncbi:GTP cyclohydrolase/3,4-dihydroxy-2-butanone 4-phosphate synthase bi-functional protein (ribofalvinbiosynthesis) [Rhizobium etli CFN 42]|uniref:GTP cyclohydrolase/3,4-dihydroxy-2-butanone 4-phosphate synthase bi-functional protein (Ribofalvinbiosynthesis) n=1 Tax=Rhizobium etli (strain ATCC 51251 / DSM 11541 / JCM 21823 / NBRC 15573 / CFN 42) TaxID=347834 RepID=Q2KBP1_RHIEC|nr:GTP cyclohydrolase/3,4-dihydroxy-2-butanone 4-phosphate synthase bi-functional protein (ribofalvinbiosynthesis) [Rhizobium etli CFN 42]